MIHINDSLYVYWRVWVIVPSKLDYITKTTGFSKHFIYLLLFFFCKPYHIAFFRTSLNFQQSFLFYSFGI